MSDDLAAVWRAAAAAANQEAAAYLARAVAAEDRLARVKVEVVQSSRYPWNIVHRIWDIIEEGTEE